ncbi:MAG: flavodoxin family protein [Thermoplasmatota archaeon]
MRVIYISGSPRNNGNTDYLLQKVKDVADGEFLKLTNFKIEPCDSCWVCRSQEGCVIDDDMTNIIIPKLMDADALVIGTPVYFNNVSSQLKTFIDRTWSIKGKLRNKIGGTIVVGRKYGHENAITAINSFFLKHEMIVANRGVSGIAFEKESITKDEEAVKASERLGERINEIYSLIYG